MNSYLAAEEFLHRITFVLADSLLQGPCCFANSKVSLCAFPESLLSQPVHTVQAGVTRRSGGVKQSMFNGALELSVSTIMAYTKTRPWLEFQDLVLACK